MFVGERGLAHLFPTEAASQHPLILDESVSGRLLRFGDEVFRFYKPTELTHGDFGLSDPKGLGQLDTVGGLFVAAACDLVLRHTQV